MMEYNENLIVLFVQQEFQLLKRTFFYVLHLFEISNESFNQEQEKKTNSIRFAKFLVSVVQ